MARPKSFNPPKYYRPAQPVVLPEPDNAFDPPVWEVEIQLSVGPADKVKPKPFSWFLTDANLKRFRDDVSQGTLGPITFHIYSIKENVA